MNKLIKDLIKNCKLTKAVEQLNNILKKEPDNRQSRGELIDILCILGEYERADKQLDMIAKQGPENMVKTMALRYLLRAAQARADFFQENRIPMFAIEPNELATKQLKFNTEKKPKLLADINKITENLQITINGKDYVGFRDLDDRTAGCFELLSFNGNYYLVPFDIVTDITFYAKKSLIDLAWPQVHVRFNNEAEQDFIMPAIYYNKNANEEMLIGRSTDWQEKQNINIGMGQKMFLCGDESITTLEIKTLILK